MHVCSAVDKGDYATDTFGGTRRGASGDARAPKLVSIAGAGELEENLRSHLCRASIASQRERRTFRERLSSMLTGRLFALLGPLDRIDDQLPCLGGIAPADQFDPFARLKILVMFEEVLDLLACDRRQVSVFMDVLVAFGEARDGYGDDLFVTAAVIMHFQYADRSHVDDGTRHDGPGVCDQNIDRIAIVGQGMRYEAIIAGIAHRRVKKPVNHERSRRFVHFVFDWLAPDRHLDNDVDVLGRMGANRNRVNVHRYSPVWSWC